MSNPVKLMNPFQIQTLYTALKPEAIKETKPAYSYWALKLPGCMVTAYTSGKVLFQGKDLWPLRKAEAILDGSASFEPASNSAISASASRSAKTKSSARPAADASLQTFPQAGSDEVGTGDYFGPMVVCAALVPDEQTARTLKDWGVTDSKKMTDERIEELGPKIAELVPCAIEILDNETYNETYNRDFNHIKIMLARLHNQAWLSLAEKHALPKTGILDQFCAKPTYFGYLEGNPAIYKDLHFETRAESKYPAVAAASVIARWVFLMEMKKMNQKWDFAFPKGAGAPVDKALRRFMQKHSMQDLAQTAKLNFANTEKTALQSMQLKI